MNNLHPAQISILNAGCNINIPDNEGVTALQHAKSRGYTGIAAILEKAAGKP